MEVDILLFEVSDKVVVYPSKIDFVNGTTFPHQFTSNGVRYDLSKFDYKDSAFLIGCSAYVSKDKIKAAIDEFQPSKLY